MRELSITTFAIFNGGSIYRSCIIRLGDKIGRRSDGETFVRVLLNAIDDSVKIDNRAQNLFHVFVNFCRETWVLADIMTWTSTSVTDELQEALRSDIDQ